MKLKDKEQFIECLLLTAFGLISLLAITVLVIIIIQFPLQFFALLGAATFLVLAPATICYKIKMRNRKKKLDK